MITLNKTENVSPELSQRILSFFSKTNRIKYNKRLSRKLRLYIGEKVEKEDTGNVLSPYKNQMQ